MQKLPIIFVILAITLISCGPSKAKLTEQTQAAATATEVSWKATVQYKDSMQQNLRSMCGDMINPSSIETGAPPESPGVVWFVLIHYDMPQEDYQSPKEKAIQIPSGEQALASVTESTTLLCVHRLHTKYDECVYNKDEFLQPTDPKTLIRYKTDTNVYLIDLTKSRMYASIEFPSGLENCPVSHRFSEGEKTSNGYFGAVDLSIIYEWADSIWKQ